MEYYKKVFIKSEDDLPKEEGRYIYGWGNIDIRVNSGTSIVYYDPNDDKEEFTEMIESYDWYLLPVEFPTDEEIIDYALDYVRHKSLKPANKGLIKDALIIGAKAMRDNKIIDK